MDSHTHMVNELRATRMEIATLEEVLALRVLDARTLRDTIEKELTSGGMAATPAKEKAKADERYLAFERATAGIQHNHDDLVAKAESQRLQLDLGIASLRLVGQAA